MSKLDIPEKSIIDVPSFILNSSVEGDNPFIDFRTDPPKPNDREAEMRHYFEACVITPGTNRNSFEVTKDAMEMVAAGYKEGAPLSINHDKGTWDNTLGYGQTVDAAVVGGKLYVASYIALRKTYPKGPFGNSEQLRDGIVDGFIKNVSQSIRPLKATCNVCNLRYPVSYEEYHMDGFCQHYRGESVIVEEDGEKVVKTVTIKIEEAEAVELSIVMIPADDGSGITKPVVNFSLNDIIDETRMDFLHKGDEVDPQLTDGDGSETPKTSNPKHKGDESVSITQEQYNAALSRATNAESQVATLTAEASNVKIEAQRLEAEVKTAQAEKKTVEAEKATVEAKLEAEEAKVVKLEAAANISKTDLEAKEKHIKELEDAEKKNALYIQDGKDARESKVEAFADAYAAAVGESCTEEMKEVQREVARALPLTTVEERIKGFQASAKENFPSGKAIKGGESGNSESSDDEGNDKEPKVDLTGI